MIKFDSIKRSVRLAAVFVLAASRCVTSSGQVVAEDPNRSDHPGTPVPGTDAPQPVAIKISQSAKPISPDLFGIFFEDINYAADGGLYAELVQNGSFEYSPADNKQWSPLTAWELVQRDGGKGAVTIESAEPLHSRNPHYAALTVEQAGGGVGLTNGGFDGIALKAGDKYDVSLFARQVAGQPAPITVRLEGKDDAVLGEATFASLTPQWTRYTATVQARADGADARLVALAGGVGTVALDAVSVFPQNTFHHRPNGLRADLAQVIADLKPKFMRFPGGCLAHGDGLDNIYRWKDTIGPVEQRQQQRNIWRYHQSVGLGYFEYFQFCEDIGAKPLPVLAAGVCCQNAGHYLPGAVRGQQGIPIEQMPAYIQDVLDLIEWANGPADSPWGRKRAEQGHPAPFGLQYLGIGNEDQITPVFRERFQMIFDAVKAKYPEITVVGTVGPAPNGGDFDKGWQFARELHVPMVDEHYYKAPAWFWENLGRYDSYDRAQSKVYAGEYAAHDVGRKSTLRAALAEAAYMTSLERNGDVVSLSSYAPLLARQKHTQWLPDMIYFDGTTVSPGASYEVQRLFGQNAGDRYLPTAVEGGAQAAEPHTPFLAASCVVDSKTGDYILKVVSQSDVPRQAQIELADAANLEPQAACTVLSGEMDAQNTPGRPLAVQPTTTGLTVAPRFTYEVPARSLSVIRIHARRNEAAAAFPLSAVRLLASPFKQAMERNADYLLSLNADRFLHNTRQYCGLEPKGELYGGWEARGISGHSLGHYLTALSQQYAATGDARFRARIDYIVGELALCQERYGDGYVGALMPLELATLRAFKDGKVEVQGAFNFKGGAWVPWYTEHKILAGLKDAWTQGGNVQAKEVTLKLADFVDRVTAGLTPEQQQTMLRVEFGGMSESLVELYELTGDRRYLETSRRFYDHRVLDPMLAGRDELPGKHANTQMPKIIGEARRYEATGDADSRRIAEFFWNRVVGQHSWVIGGNSDREHFFPVNQTAQHLGPETAETCNSYNMLKLTEHLFEWEPQAAYGDFYERTLYNHILASQEPRQGMFTYFLSLEPGHFRTYSTATNSFWCCVGTGMENHTKYGEAIYFHGADDLYVNLFIPSELTWTERGLTLEQQTAYPASGQTDLTIKTAPTTPLKLHVRCPAWATGPLQFQINGEPLAVEAAPGRFAEIQRVWHAGDRVRVTIPMGLRTETLPGAPGKVAFLYGPLVLAGDLGPVPESATVPYSGDHTKNDHAPGAVVPALVHDGDEASLLRCFVPVPSQSATFRTAGLGQPQEVTLRPFKDLAYNYYNVYWDTFTAADWAQRKAVLEAAAIRRRAEESRVVDEYHPGEQQSEVDHHLTSDHSQIGEVRNRKWRDARDGGYFAFELKTLRGVPLVLRCTYLGDETGARTFDILANGKLLATETLHRNKPGGFFDVEYPVPAELAAQTASLTVRFQPHAQNAAGGLFQCTLLKAESQAR